MISSYYKNPTLLEVGVDESGRGPLFGRVYAAAVILPFPNESESSESSSERFDYSLLRDSKKFHSKKKIREVAEYIQTHALAWSVTYEDEKSIDSLNILQATQVAMRRAIVEVIQKIHPTALQPQPRFFLFIDGNYFTPICVDGSFVPHQTMVKGDDQVCCIAAASILAKVFRDTYIEELCREHPYLSIRYGIDTNMGYGTKRHYEGIATYGVTPWHRGWADKGGGVWRTDKTKKGENNKEG